MTSNPSTADPAPDKSGGDAHSEDESSTNAPLVDDSSTTQRVETDEAEARVYYPALDGLRFFAFVLVYISHDGLGPLLNAVNLAFVLITDPILALLGDRVGLASWTVTRFAANGWVGVPLFFILSGFLITTLLLREEERFGRIDLRSFWIRRILRIWPLFYLTLLIGFIVLPALSGQLFEASYWAGNAQGGQWPAFVLFLGNWAIIQNGMIVTEVVGITWSVCVEEQFYLLVPFLLVGVSRRWRIPLVVALMVFSTYWRYRLAARGVEQIVIQFHSLTLLDTLLCGVLMALLFRGRPPDPRLGRWLGWSQILIWPLVIFVMTRSELGHGPTYRRTWDFVYLYLLGAVLVSLAIAHRGLWSRLLSIGWIVWLGRISYGLYMFHEVGLLLRETLRPTLSLINDTLIRDLLAETISLGSTIGMAAVSYQYFERRFLRLKTRFTRVASRPV